VWWWLLYCKCTTECYSKRMVTISQYLIMLRSNWNLVTDFLCITQYMKQLSTCIWTELNNVNMYAYPSTWKLTAAASISRVNGNEDYGCRLSEAKPWTPIGFLAFYWSHRSNCTLCVLQPQPTAQIVHNCTIKMQWRTVLPAVLVASQEAHLNITPTSSRFSREKTTR